MEYIEFPKLNKYLYERTSADTENPELHVCLAMAQQVTCLSLWRPRFNSRPLNVEFVVDKGTVGLVFSAHVAFPLQVFTPMPQTHLFIYF
jgi:hypothetical protein